MEENKKVLEICCDASIKTYPNGRTFGCAGAIATGYNIKKIKVIPDTTNNRSELFAMFLAIKLAEELQVMTRFDEVIIYSDSKFTVFGLKVWMDKWLSSRDANGIMYGYNNEPVKNQELFGMIISYMVKNNLRFNIRHQKGHINQTEKKLQIADRVFFESNGYHLDRETLSRISFYNDIIDKTTKQVLMTTNPDMYPIININTDNSVMMCNYIIPSNYKEYIL